MSSGTAPAARDVDLLDTPNAGTLAIRGGIVRLAGYGITVAVSVVSSALLLRHLGVVATGEYVTVLSIVSVAVGVTDAGVTAVGVRELSILSPGPAHHFFRSVFGLRLAFALIGVLLASVFAALDGYSSTLVLGVVIAGVAFLLASVQTSYALPLLVRMRLVPVTGLEILRQVGGSVVIIGLVVADAPLLSFWAAAIPVGLLTMILSALLVRGDVSVSPAFDRAIWVSLVRRTLPYSLASAVGVIYFRLAILVMSNVASGRQAGYFSASFRVIEVLFVVPQLIVGATLPIFARAARDDRARLEYALGRMFEVCLLLGVGAGLLLVTGGDFIIEVVAGSKFAPAAEVLRIQGLALVATFASAVFAYALLSLGRYRDVLRINLMVLAASGILTGLMATSYGAVGAAIATTFVEIVYSGLLAVAVLRTGTHPQILRRVPVCVGSAALLGALALAPPGLPNIARPVIALAIYCSALLALGVVPAELLERIPRLSRSQRM